MSQSILFNGLTYVIPDTGDQDWGENLTDYFVAIPQGALQKSGGAFTLTADVNFGATFGILAAYYKSRAANIATAGLVRMARADTVVWRNTANDGNLALAVDTDDDLTFNGSKIQQGLSVSDTTTIDLTLTGDTLSADVNALSIDTAQLANLGVTNGKLAAGAVTNSKLAADAVVNVNVDAAAAITRSKLATGTNYRILANNASGVISENAALTANQVIIADTNGQLAGEATLAKSRGGTGQDNSSLTFPASGTVQATTPNNHGVLLSGSGATATVLAPNASTALPLVSGGSSADPSWAALTVAGGGTGLTSGTSGGIPYFSSTSAITSSGLLTANAVLVGGGAGAAPAPLASLGTSGQLLTSNGAGVPPSFQTVSLSKVEAIYTITGATAVGTVNTGATTILDFNSQISDSATLVTTGASWKFTCPTGGTGFYQVSACAGVTQLTDGNRIQLLLYKNGSLYCLLSHQRSSSSLAQTICSGPGLVSLVPTDFIDIRLSNGDSSNRSVDTTAGFGVVGIMKIPST